MPKAEVLQTIDANFNFFLCSVAQKPRNCTMCKNHGRREPTAGHRCPYRDCPCPQCGQTRATKAAVASLKKRNYVPKASR